MSSSTARPTDWSASGMTEKQGDGRWIWEDFEFEPASGEYFAVAPLTNKCKSAVSKIFTYPDDN